MPLKTIVTVPFVSINYVERGSTGSLGNYAQSLAATQNAHLSVVVAALKLNGLSAFGASAKSLVEGANEEVKKAATAIADDACATFTSRAIVGDATVVFEEYRALCDQVLRHVRIADVAVMQPQDTVLSLQQGLLETVLFESGRPVIVEPTGWDGQASSSKVLVSWDGSAKSARAVGDALPLLQDATEVEIVSISGDTKHKELDGAGLARHLSRHCKKVSIIQLPASNGDVAEALSNHARNIRADLIVMGAYGHSRLHQMVWGGVTSAMIYNPPVPVFMSY